MTFDDFDSNFQLLTGHGPFPWQRALFGELLHTRFPATCDIPTGLGKTSIMAIWLLALAHHARACTADGFPRRLAHVVNRRTVVDQATREAGQMREALAAKPGLRSVADDLQSLALPSSDTPLAISTLRGQFADNAEWRNDPARPAVIVGTVDMIGSRLLFAGYACGFKSRPLHAGFLGQDTLLVHDEAHLEPAFQELITAIESEQRRCREGGAQADFRGFRVMALT
ncbi:MAG TPA: type I-U CRISPR-associated helicase/endonuclease Cas3, partial [Vicinamibacteria bacterium]|nr:type I-U CRISPR-associated helicase/endonuclease Cas3 [Vicinamibacteria bacterium]